MHAHDFEVDREQRTILLAEHLFGSGTDTETHAASRRTIRVPKMFGELGTIEQRANYLVVQGEHGKASYHLTRAHGNLGAGCRVGFMAWHSLRKAIRKLCMLPAAGKRVDMQVTYYRNSGGNSSEGAHGRVMLDRAIVCQGRDIAHHLGKSLEAYLHLSAEARLASTDSMIHAFALLDHELPDSAVVGVSPPVPASGLWDAFFKLRMDLR